MKLIIEQGTGDAHEICLYHGDCTCADSYTMGPCVFCGGQYVESCDSSFTAHIEGGEDPEALRHGGCCGTCARLTFSELRMVVDDQVPYLDYETNYVNAHCNVLEALPELKQVSHYMACHFGGLYTRLQHFKMILACESLERRYCVEPKGFVYLLASPEGYCKIGRAANLNARLKQIGLQLPFKVELIHSIPVVNPIQAERAMHLKFAGQRMNGEWFNLSTEDIEWFKGQSAIRETQGV